MRDLLLELAETADRIPGSLAFTSRAGSLRYGDLVGKIACSITKAKHEGIEPGQVVLVACANLDARLIICLALMQIGCRVGLVPDLNLYAASNLSVDALVASSPQPNWKSSTKLVQISGDWFKPLSASERELPPTAPEQSVIFASSGSTGVPKLIEWRRSGILRRIEERLSDETVPERPRFMSLAGDAAGTTFWEIIGTLLRGGVVIRPPGSDMRQPGYEIPTALDTIQSFLPNYCITVPATLSRLLDNLKSTPRAIEKIAVLRVSGAVCVPTLQNAALDQIAETLVNAYGTTEIGRIAQGYSTEIQRIQGSVGRIKDGIEVAAFNDKDERLPQGSQGEVRVRVPEAAIGTYPAIAKEAGEQSTFVDGWFRTGDLGLVDAEGNLIVRGRTSNVLNIGGAKISAERVESALASMQEIRDVGVSVRDTEDGVQHLVAVIASDSQLTLDIVNKRLGRDNIPFRVRALFVVPDIPRTESNKIDRSALRRIALGTSGLVDSDLPS